MRWWLVLVPRDHASFVACVLLFLAFSSRVAIINFIAAQMKIDKNGKIGRKQLRGRSGSSCSNKQGASVASFFGKPQTTSLDSLTRSSVLDHASTRANSPASTSSPKLDRRFRTAKKNESGAAVRKNERNKRLRTHSGTRKINQNTQDHICFALREESFSRIACRAKN